MTRKIVSCGPRCLGPPRQPPLVLLARPVRASVLGGRGNAGYRRVRAKPLCAARSGRRSAAAMACRTRNDDRRSDSARAARAAAQMRAAGTRQRPASTEKRQLDRAAAAATSSPTPPLSRYNTAPTGERFDQQRRARVVFRQIENTPRPQRDRELLASQSPSRWTFGGPSLRNRPQSTKSMSGCRQTPVDAPGPLAWIGAPRCARDAYTTGLNSRRGRGA